LKEEAEGNALQSIRGTSVLNFRKNTGRKELAARRGKKWQGGGEGEGNTVGPEWKIQKKEKRTYWLKSTETRCEGSRALKTLRSSSVLKSDGGDKHFQREKTLKCRMLDKKGSHQGEKRKASENQTREGAPREGKGTLGEKWGGGGGGEGAS